MSGGGKIARGLGQKLRAYRLRQEVLKSGLFSPQWYLSAYADVAEAGVDPYQHYLEFGWREGRNPGPDFNTLSYLEANPDVRNADINPLIHYVLSGKREGRLLGAESLRRLASRARLRRDNGPAGVVAFEKTVLPATLGKTGAAAFSIAFMASDKKGESIRYRVFHVMEALESRNITAHCFEDQEIPDKLNRILSHDLIVLFRYPWSPNIEQLITRARAMAIPLVYDIDDYVFDPAISPRVDGVRLMPDHERSLFRDGILRYRACLEQCDYATAPTEFLARLETDFVKKSYVIINTVNAEQLRICREIGRRPAEARTEEITLGYFSGSLTHQKDFEQVYPALLRLLKAFPQVRLSIKGEFHLAEFPDLKKFAARIVQPPFSPWRELPLAISQVDINLIPLEPNSLFCESKSELKYFEAAILGVPSVASEVGPYKYAIKHGRNGLLAQSPEDWYDCLISLVVDADYRKSLGAAAKAHALEHYAPENLARIAEAVYRDILDDFSKTSAERAAPRL